MSAKAIELHNVNVTTKGSDIIKIDLDGVDMKVRAFTVCEQVGELTRVTLEFEATVFFESENHE